MAHEPPGIHYRPAAGRAEPDAADRRAAARRLAGDLAGECGSGLELRYVRHQRARAAGNDADGALAPEAHPHPGSGIFPAGPAAALIALVQPLVADGRAL